MSVIQNNLLLAGDDAYNLTRSLRFRRGSPSYLNRTFSSGDKRAWTWSAWVKRTVLSTDNSTIFDTNSSVAGATRGGIKFRDDCLYINQNPSGSSQTTELKSTAVFRDPSAWYHVVVAWDTAQATASNRVKLYVNGVQITSFQISTYPSQNTDSALNGTTVHKLGTDGPNSTAESFDGYLAEVHFIDGQALTPSSFGANNASTGVWQPKKYAGTYGTNGFYLPFTDNSALTTSSNVGLGKDFSGNGNYWTTNNISITAGSTYDSMTDVPTLTSATAANFAVMNRLFSHPNLTLSAGNLDVTGSGGNTGLATLAVSSGKWYYECTITRDSTTNPFIGVSRTSNNIWNGSSLGANSDGWSIATGSDATNGGKVFNNNTFGTNYGPFANGDVVMVAFDVSDGKLWFGKNGTWFNSGVPSSGTNAIYTNLSGEIAPACSQNGTSKGEFNFGQRPFAYTPPTGFVALNTFNLPTPTIGATASTQANKYFDINVWTGNTSTQTITNSGGFQPDLVWIKNRSSARFNNLYNSVSGLGKRLFSNATDAEQTITAANYLSSFNSNGFSLGFDIDVNESPYSYVGWQWKAGGTAVTNTAGSITSTVSANTSAGFSVVTYTGTGANATVGHGLGVAPSMIIVKTRNISQNWIVYHSTLGKDKLLYLNNTDSAITNSDYWGTGGVTSTVFGLKGGGFSHNLSSEPYVAYCFAQIAGYSRFGSYTGNGSADGTFVFTGFRPKFVIWKNATTSGNGWLMMDSARNPTNAANSRLYPDFNYAEDTGNATDFLSNGFKLRTTGSNQNENGSTFIYMAFAENPFKYSLAR